MITFSKDRFYSGMFEGIVKIFCVLQGSLESVIGIGLMAGPTLAGTLYDVS